MKRNALTVIVGAILILLFVLLLFTFQVRQTEVAVVTTFDRPSRYIEEPGFNWKWPVPIQKVYKFDKRTQNFEGRFEQTLTADGHPLLALVYVGWSIQEPQKFFRSFPGGTTQEAEGFLEELVRSAKNAVIGDHPFSHFISPNEEQLRLDEIESEILAAVRESALAKYGIDIEFVGFKRLGLPEQVTEKVFERMKAERQREVDRLQAMGEAQSLNIRSAADRDRDQILAKAEAQATAIRGEADAEASKAYAVLDQNPDLAITLIKLRALEQILKNKSTLILDERTPPFDLLNKRMDLHQTQPKPERSLSPDTNSETDTETTSPTVELSRE